MSTLAGARVVLGVSGGIAAYKAVEVCRRLVDAGSHVVPVLTEDAQRFVGRVTFSALASEPARTSLWDDGADPIPHTRLGQGADVIVVAPATAHLLGRYTAGLADDLLTATLLATRAPVVVCPAMHTEMWEHAAVQANLATLAGRGVRVVPPAEGRLAGGDVGAGRLAEPGDIVAAVEAALAAAPAGGPGPSLAGLRVLVTAGGTREAIDPVRFIGNRSSGKQGHAVAAEAARRGAAVTLVTTTGLPAPAGAEVVRVESAEEMEAAVRAAAPGADIVVMAAAVADFRPKVAADQKIKKDTGPPEVVLEPTPDILAGLATTRRAGQVLVGFAAETTDVIAHARDKVRRKGVDLIVANDVSAPGVGFEHDTNAVTIVGPDGPVTETGLTTKDRVAAAVLDAAVSRLTTIPPQGETS
ncbi:MAG TPA: bifunctional phosphopantothenoylcysteine decarboxylase/phosphopantothenate--cysteine ligase CoaBC [Acidimicrobiales bacterium]|nr:bifunctional phosphopantothenoylcysteine decarboxylase/phosphopantothenate--cysteine ligase CoaBC [Acidimicrobiales bacterium]